jgi:hypothetical protein
VESHYRHTQIGWVILGVLGGIGVLVAPRLPAGGFGIAGGPLLAILVVALLLFSTLTVEVDKEALRLRFGVGLIRKRFDLAEIRGWEAVRNPWYCGWGIRLRPRSVLWNVSGYDAVELTLADGRRFRIGTDEPDALVAAIARARPGVSADSADVPAAPRGATPWVPLLLIGLALLIVVGGIFRVQMRPPAVSVRANSFEVESLFYGTTFAADDITAISLEPTLPRVLARTNGFAAGGALRGHFNVEGLGAGRLYVDLGAAPYLLVRLRNGFVIVNLPQPEQTRALYEQMAQAWPDRAAGEP